MFFTVYLSFDKRTNFVTFSITKAKEYHSSFLFIVQYFLFLPLLEMHSPSLLTVLFRFLLVGFLYSKHSLYIYTSISVIPGLKVASKLKLGLGLAAIF